MSNRYRYREKETSKHILFVKWSLLYIVSNEETITNKNYKFFPLEPKKRITTREQIKTQSHRRKSVREACISSSVLPLVSGTIA